MSIPELKQFMMIMDTIHDFMDVRMILNLTDAQIQDNVYKRLAQIKMLGNKDEYEAYVEFIESRIQNIRDKHESAPPSEANKKIAEYLKHYVFEQDIGEIYSVITNILKGYNKNGVIRNAQLKEFIYDNVGYSSGTKISKPSNFEAKCLALVEQLCSDRFASGEYIYGPAGAAGPAGPAGPAIYADLQRRLGVEQLYLVLDANRLTGDEVIAMNPDGGRFVYQGNMTNNDSANTKKFSARYAVSDEINPTYVLRKANNELFRFYEYGSFDRVLQVRPNPGAHFEIGSSALGKNTVSTLSEIMYFVIRSTATLDARFTRPMEAANSANVLIVDYLRIYTDLSIAVDYGIRVEHDSDLAERNQEYARAVQMGKIEYILCLFDIKASGDRLQVKAVETFNASGAAAAEAAAAVFVSNDQLAVAYAIATSQPAILTSKDKESGGTKMAFYYPPRAAEAAEAAEALAGLRLGGTGASAAAAAAAARVYTQQRSRAVGSRSRASAAAAAAALERPIHPLTAALLHVEQPAMAQFFFALSRLDYPLTVFEYLRFRFVLSMLPPNFVERLDRRPGIRRQEADFWAHLGRGVPQWAGGGAGLRQPPKSY